LSGRFLTVLANTVLTELTCGSRVQLAVLAGLEAVALIGFAGCAETLATVFAEESDTHMERVSRFRKRTVTFPHSIRPCEEVLGSN
jgi:hypothetical protein